MDPSDDFDRGRQWFEWYLEQYRNSVQRPEAEGPYNCPCCGCLTLSERGMYDICPVCFWEDDGQDEHDAEVVRGGPNGSLSLAQARENYRQFGACDERMKKNVRPPLAHELPPR